MYTRTILTHVSCMLIRSCTHFPTAILCVDSAPSEIALDLFACVTFFIPTWTAVLVVSRICRVAFAPTPFFVCASTHHSGLDLIERTDCHIGRVRVFVVVTKLFTNLYYSLPAAFDGAAVKNSNMVRENNDHIEDGAGDAMLAPTNEKEQLALTNEVKFISAEHKNGDAKIDIGITLEKVSAVSNSNTGVVRFILYFVWLRAYTERVTRDRVQNVLCIESWVTKE